MSRRPRRQPLAYSFHMVLSCSRDPFCRHVARQDLATFWACHAAAFAHFGELARVVYDRTKTVIRSTSRGEPVELHPEAVAFAAHYGFALRVCWPERPQAKGRVERTVELTREKVAAGRELATLQGVAGGLGRVAAGEKGPGAPHAWRGDRRGPAERDRAALGGAVAALRDDAERHLRVVGKDALVSFEAP